MRTSHRKPKAETPIKTFFKSNRQARKTKNRNLMKPVQNRTASMKNGPRMTRTPTVGL